MEYSIRQNNRKGRILMDNIQTKTNSIELAGELTDKIELSHTVYGEKFYSCFLNIKRLSNRTDSVPVTIPERLLVQHRIKSGDKVHIEGQLRSYNYYLKVDDLAMNKKSRLVVTAFCKNVLPYEEDVNCVKLDGYVCKTPIYRVTPFGKHICDLLIAVNRNYGKSDYIPVIYWGENAKKASALTVSSNVFVTGRLQSREYEKRKDDGDITVKTTYEVSGFELNC